MVRIFLISDRENVIKQFGELCKENSYEFHTCSDIKIIEEILEAETFDIILLDNESGSLALNLSKQLKNTAGGILLLTGKNDIPKELLKSINAILPEDFSKELVLAALNINLRMKGSLQKLANTNKDLAASLYRQNTLYNISSQFAGTLDKAQLLEFMIEGLDKALSFSLTCTLSFCTEEKPVLILNSLYEISEELLNAIKLRTILNYRALFDGKQAPYEIDENTLKVIKHVKYPASRFNFTLFQFDNMFAPIALGENFYGCVEIFKEAHFTAEDAKCFQTIAQQVSLPLKNATLYQEIIETNKKLERLEKLKSEFISIVSHELRTPLTVLSLGVESLQNDDESKLSGFAQEVMRDMQHETKYMSRLIEALLTLARGDE